MGATNVLRDIPLYAELYLQGRLKLDELISRTISLDEINEGYADLAGGSATRTVITKF